MGDETMVEKVEHRAETVLSSVTSKQTIPAKNLGLTTLNHFGVAVRDLERSIAFYRALTGEEPSGRGTWSSEGLGHAAGVDGRATVTWAAFRLGNVNIDLLQVDEPGTEPAEYELAQLGAMHVCFEVDDLPAVYERMEAAGIAFLGPYHQVTAEEDGAQEGLGVVVAYFDGPDGEHLELIAPTGPFVRKAQIGAH